MTLDTRIYIYDKVDQDEVKAKVDELLGIENPRSYEEMGSGPYGCVDEGTRELSNRIAQGFNAWVMTYSNPDGIRYSDEHKAEQERWHNEYHEDPEDCSPERCPADLDFSKLEHDAGIHYMQISMDTAYGFRNDKGWNCTTLHAWVIINLGSWLDERGIRWAWENEYTGEIHHGLDKEALEEFLGGGRDAAAWFHGTVMPVIKSQYPGAEF